MLWYCDDIILISYRSVLQQLDLPLKRDIYTSQHQRRWRSALTADSQRQIERLQSTGLSSTICDGSACWSPVPGSRLLVPVLSISLSDCWVH